PSQRADSSNWVQPHNKTNYQMRVTIETVALVLAAFAAAPSDGFVFNKNRAVLTSNRHDDAFLPQRSARPNGGSNTQLNMMFDQLSSALTDVAKNFGGKQRMTENSIQPALKSVRRALLDADVNVDVATALIEGVKRRSLGKEVTKGVTAEQQFIKAMYDELLDMMGGDAEAQGNNGMVGSPSLQSPTATLAYSSDSSKPAVILLAGLQGAGKTTAAGKLALYLKEREVDPNAISELSEEERSKTLASRLPKRNRKVLLAAADVYRPAAIEQLQILGKQIDVEVFSMGVDADPADIAKAAVEKAKKEGFDTVVVDTAGRQVVDEELMEELRRVKKTVQPDETLLVVDAMTGQAAASLTASFDSAVGITGALLTKLDGDSRGGAAVSIRGVSGKPIKFVGVGEKTADLEPFYPDRMASRILGMGDVISLVEKASMEVSDADAARMQEKMAKAEFDFDDFMNQSKMVSKMGSMAGVAKMLPGLGGMIDNSQMAQVEKRIKRSEAMICSMTKRERANPELVLTDKTGRSRITRITKGAGLAFEDGLTFMSEFQKMRTMMSRMSKQAGMGVSPEEGGDAEMMPAMAGNRNARRAAKKKGKKGGRGGGMGFGAR
ncbi:signal recognition particle subunit SRP54, partial [Skeletonema marinoi]